MATITKSLTIESQGTYNLTFDLWSYSEWAASAGITTSYASLAALIADEKAVRQLMTVHASVDYFANCPDSTIISTVINNDLCAKWINLRDYALDTLSAKSNIKSVMDTADKYGYGEWGKINSTTWGPLGNVPIMTANDAPYGVASNYEAFNGNGQSVTAAITDCSYQSVEPICVKKFAVAIDRACTVTLQGSNNGSTWTNIGEAQTYSNVGSLISYKVNGNTFYMYHRAHLSTASKIGVLQFYGRELTVKQASAPTDGREYIQIGSDYYTEDWGEKEFAQGSTRKTIYDHGVELVDLGNPIVSGSAVAEKRGSELYGKLVSGSANSYAFSPTSAIDLSNYSQMRGIAGDELYAPSNLYPFRIAIKATRSYSNSDYTMIAEKWLGLPLTDLNITLDISNVTQSAYPMFQNSTSGSNQIATLKEWWLE